MSNPHIHVFENQEAIVNGIKSILFKASLDHQNGHISYLGLFTAPAGTKLHDLAKFVERAFA